MSPTKGFTLIELMLVIAVIGVLASIAVPSYGHFVTKAKLVKAVLAVRNCQKKLQIELITSNSRMAVHQGFLNGRCQGDLETADLVGVSINYYDWNTITYTFGPSYPAELAGETISMRSMPNTADKSWNCWFYHTTAAAKTYNSSFGC